MPDPTLHENGEPCPACALRREDMDLAVIWRPDVPCNNCGGTGRVALPTQTIIDHSVAWARLHYWPAFMKRNGM